jgi:glutathione reductase (NADPH)
MWSAAHIADILRHDAHQYGFDVVNEEKTVKLDFAKLKKARDAYVTRLNAIYANSLQTAGITCVYGEGTFVDAHTIQVVEDNNNNIKTMKYYTADKIVIATGGRPHFPPGEGISEHCLSSDGFFEVMEELPAVAVIVGAGYIAVELAGVLNSLGTEVHLAVRKGRALREFDPMISEGLDEEMIRAGIHVHRNTNGVAKVALDRDGKKKNVTFHNGDVIYGVDIVLMAAGRVPNTERLCSNSNENNGQDNDHGGDNCADCTTWAPNIEKLHLECCGVAVSSNNNYIIVDEYQNTNVPNIFALG